METSEFFRPRFEAAVKVMIQAIMQYARQAGKKQKEKYNMLYFNGLSVFDGLL